MGQRRTTAHTNGPQSQCVSSRASQSGQLSWHRAHTASNLIGFTSWISTTSIQAALQVGGGCSLRQAQALNIIQVYRPLRGGRALRWRRSALQLKLPIEVKQKNIAGRSSQRERCRQQQGSLHHKVVRKYLQSSQVFLRRACCA